MKNSFIMFVGLPGSGKTTAAKELIKERSSYYEAVGIKRSVEWISSDALRDELLGNINDQSDNAGIFKEMFVRTCQALEAGNDVIYDACNINAKRRMALLQNLKKYPCEKVCYIIATPFQKCLERDRSNRRDHVVGKNGITKNYFGWKTPYYFEGWDEIAIRYSEDAMQSLGTPKAFVDSLMEYDQENPHHKESLGRHMQLCKEYVVEKGASEDSNLAIAALLHDCGKPFARTYGVDKNGEKIAHYYKHESCGGYDALFYDYRGKEDVKDILEISALICYHMYPFGWDLETTKAKYLKAWGRDFYDKIELLHEADVASSFE